MEPTADEVRLQLDRLLASEGFANADRMSGFLRYVVERSLAGENDRVKEYVIGVEVFGRDQTYDPRLDSIVRVEARRLRAKVEEYYGREGQSDPIIIRMRRGSYVPAFERRADVPRESPAGPATASAPPGLGIRWRLGLGLALAALVLLAVATRGGLWATSVPQAPAVSIAVLPFAQYSTNVSDALLAARLTDGVTSELAKIGTLGVVSHTSALQFAERPRKPAREIAQTLDADVLMEGSVSTSGDRIDVEVRLVNGTTDRKMWVETFTGTAQDPRDLERRIAIATVPFALQSRPAPR